MHLSQTTQHHDLTSGGPIHVPGLSQLVRKYISHWPLFGCSLLLCLCAAVLYLRFATPVYLSSAKVLIKEENNSLAESAFVDAFNMFASGKSVENEMEIIRSVSTISEVVKNLKLYATISKVGRIQNKAIYVSSPVIFEVHDCSSISSEQEIEFAFDSSGRIILGGEVRITVGEWTNILGKQSRFLSNPHFSDSTAQGNYRLTIRPVEEITSQLLEELEVEPAGKQSSIIYLRLKDVSRRRAENILNEIISVYNAAGLRDKNALAANTLAFVNERLRFVTTELDSVEQAIQQFKSTNEVVDLSTQGRLFLELAGKSNDDITKASVQLAVLDEIQKHVLNSPGASGPIIPSTLGITDPVLLELLTRYYEAETRYTSLRKTTAEKNLLMLAIREEMNLLRPTIVENIKTQKQSLELSLSTLGKSRSEYDQLLHSLPEKERELLQIGREQSIKNNIYSFLLQKREETALTLASTVADFRLIDKPNSSARPVAPKKLLVFVVAFCAAMFTTTLIITAKGIFNFKVTTATQITTTSGLPLLGEIRYQKTTDAIVMTEGVRNIVSEQFRQLRTSLAYIGINNKNKKLLVTSSISGEGKSFITANLGITMAMAGKKTILLELDLRRPTLSKILGDTGEPGFTNYIVNDLYPNQIIKQSNKHPQLYILSSGPIPPNPSELLLNPKLDTLLAHLEREFEFIVIDTAPLTPVTDGFILSAKTDATLFVVRYGYTPITMLEKLRSHIHANTISNVAATFNGVKRRSFGVYAQNEYDYNSKYFDPK